MLNFFPSLLFLSFFIPTILRLGAGLTFLYIGYVTTTHNHKKLYTLITRKKKSFLKYFVYILGGLELLVGGFIFIGFSTQLVALIGIYLSVILIILRRQTKAVSPVDSYALGLLSLILLTLLISGAGIYAVDVPF